jgi:hypothetical protein
MSIDNAIFSRISIYDLLRKIGNIDLERDKTIIALSLDENNHFYKISIDSRIDESFTYSGYPLRTIQFEIAKKVFKNNPYLNFYIQYTSIKPYDVITKENLDREKIFYDHKRVVDYRELYDVLFIEENKLNKKVETKIITKQ